MVFNTITGGENYKPRFNHSNLGRNARNAAEKLEGLRQKQQAAQTGQNEKADEADEVTNETAVQQADDKTAATGADDNAAAKYGPRETKLVNGLMKQVDKLLARFNTPPLPAESADTASTASAGKDFGLSNWLNDFDLGSLGLLDQLGGSEALANQFAGADGFSFEAAKVQFSLNLSVVHSVATAEGFTQTSLNVSLKMDLSWMSLGATSGANAADASAAETDKTQGQDLASSLLPSVDAAKGYPGFTDFLKMLGFGDLSGVLGGTGGSGDANAAGPMDAFLEYYNPENTANRILDFATAFYPSSKFAKDGDTEESRQAFADYMGKAIQKGFDQAQGILGKVDNKTQGGIDDTHKRVFDGLEQFVKGAKKNDPQTVAQVQAWKFSLELNYSYTRTTTTYNANGRTQSATPSSASAPAALDAEA